MISMKTGWRLSPLIFMLCLGGGEVLGQDLQTPFPFAPATPPGATPPLINPPEVKRLPPVGEGFSPAEWVAAPPSQDLLLEPILKTPSESAPAISLPPGSTQMAVPSPLSPPARPEKIKLWEGSLSVGLDGAEGNSEAMNFRVGFDAKRKTDFHILYLNADYNWRTTNAANTANRLFSQARYERLFQDSEWTMFVGGTGEYDEFQPWKCRVTSHAGLGRWLFKSSEASLKGRLGGGFSHEASGLKDKYYAPEMDVGLDYEQKISARQRLVGMIDYMPDVTDFTEFRLNSQAGWEVILDENPKLSLRIAVRDTYASSSGTPRPNNFDYAALLLLHF